MVVGGYVATTGAAEHLQGHALFNKGRHSPAMETLYRIIVGTPLWVFAILAYLVWQGVAALRTRTVPVWRALIVPMVFIAMGLSRMAVGHETGMTPYLFWLVGVVLAAPLAFVTGPRIVAVDRPTGLVTRPGSPVPLIQNVTVFALQYLVAVAGAMHLSRDSELAILGHIVSGGSAGYFAAWARSLPQAVSRSRRIPLVKRDIPCFRQAGAPCPAQRSFCSNVSITSRSRSLSGASVSCEIA